MEEKQGRQALIRYSVLGGVILLLALVVGAAIHQAAAAKPLLFKVKYFYSPTCPNCIAVKPFIEYLQTRYGVQIEWIDVTNHSEAVEEEVEAWNITAVPTLLVLTVEGDRVGGYYYVGRIGVLDAEPFLAELMGMPPPERPYNINETRLDPMTCLQCHAQRNLSMPSTYSCDACCHKGTTSVGGLPGD